MTKAEKRTIDEALARFSLIRGAGSEDTNEACAMTLLAWVAGREWTDAPPCAHRLIGPQVISVNDAEGTTRAMRSAIVKIGETAILDTWWVPDSVILWAMARSKDSVRGTPYAELMKTLRRVAKWKLDKGLPPNLRSANLSSADLRYADLSSANLSSANLSSADLSSANLSSANLSSANLRYANLSSANLSSANLRYANLSSANLRSANLRYANLSYAVRGNQHTILPSGWKVNEAGLIVKDDK